MRERLRWHRPAAVLRTSGRSSAKSGPAPLFETSETSRDLLLGAGAREQLIDQPIRQQPLDLLGELGCLRSARSAGASLRSPYGLAPQHGGSPTLHANNTHQLSQQVDR